MRTTSAVSKFGLLLGIAGAVAWGLVGIFEWNPIKAIFADGTQLATTGERIIYIVLLAGGLISIPLFMAVMERRSRDRSRVGMRSDYRSGATSALGLVGKLGLLLTIVGTVVWGLIGIFEWNLVKAIFEDGTQLATVGERIVYIAVFAGGLFSVPLFVAAMRGRGTMGSLEEGGFESREERRRAA